MTHKKGHVAWSRTITAGIVAGGIMMITSSLIEFWFDGGLWTHLVFLSGVILPHVQDVAIPAAFGAIEVGLGILIHAVDSLILAIIFALIFPHLTTNAWALMLFGTVYTALAFLLSWFVLIPLLNPVMHELLGGYLLISYIVFGAIMGLMIGMAAHTPTRHPATHPTPA